VLFHLNPHQCAEMCSEIAEPVHKRVDECLPERERVGDSEWMGDCRVLALQKVVAECVGRSAARRPMTKWDSIAANHGVHGKAPSGRRMHVKRSIETVEFGKRVDILLWHTLNWCSSSTLAPRVYPP
jgi:hypothetical protein